jgi:hypothetical protein
VSRLWLPSVAIVVAILNSYFFTEAGFLKYQSGHGLSAATFPPLFGYVFVPSGLPAVFGLQTLPPGVIAPHLDLTIVLALLGIVGTLAASAVLARRGAASAIVLLVEAVLGVLLIAKNSDFGIFKLMMYVQPFLAALAATVLATVSRRTVAAVCVLAGGLLLAAQLSTQQAYVKASRDPGDVPNLSSAGLIPAFHMATRHSSSIVSVTTNPVLIKLEAANAEGRHLYFQSRNVFAELLSNYVENDNRVPHEAVERALKSQAWRSRSFALLNGTQAHDNFEEAIEAGRVLASGKCTLSVPGVGEEPLNRYSLPASPAALLTLPCSAPRDLLAFTSSTLGESFYLPFKRQHISYNQLQPDPFYPSQTLVGFGRYALFRVLGWTPGSRLELSMTETLTHNGSNLLPAAAVVGAARSSLPLAGRGSARVFSPPLSPQMIAGAPYLLLDMGIEGKLPTNKLSGIQGLYGRSVPTDPRFLTGYVRDISLVSPAQYAGLRPPLALSSFPDSLNNDGLEYSGIYEDGWMAGDSYVKLAGGPSTNLVVRGEVPQGAGKHLQVRVNGRAVTSVAVAPGPLDVRVPVPASRGARRLELHFATTIPLKAPDLRPVAIFLSYLGFEAPVGTQTN